MKLKLSLPAKISLMVVGGLLLLATATQITIYYTLLSDADERTQARQEENMQVAWHVIRGYGEEFRLEGDRIYIGDTALNEFYEPVDKVREMVGGTATVFMVDTRVSTNVKKPDGSRAVGTKLAPGPVYDAVLKRGEPFRGEADILGSMYYTAYDPIKDAAGKTIGVLYVGLPKEQFFASVDRIAWTTLGLIVAVLTVVALGALWAGRRMFAPLQGLSKAIDSLAEGDTDVAVPGTERHDDIGRMARSVARLKDGAIEKERVEADAARHREDAEALQKRETASRSQAAEQQAIVVREIAQGLAKLSEGNLTYRIQAEFPGEYRQLRDDFNSVIAGLQETMKTIVGSTEAIKSGTGEISQASDDLSRRTEQQAASLEETAAALDEITATVRKTAEGANHARDVVSKAKVRAEESGSVVGNAVEAMSGIENSSKQISQIIGVIDEIAFQTNLLALNAGVEAARAGDAGKGFAVVAQEVRALAQRSADAAKEIKDLIQTSTGQVEQGVDLVGRAGEALQEIATQVNEINDIVRDISGSAQEQATALGEVNSAVNQMDQVTQQNAAMVEQQTAAAHSLSSETSELVRMMARFEIGGEAARPAANKPAAAQKSRPATRAITPKAPAMAGNTALKIEPDEEGWEEF